MFRKKRQQFVISHNLDISLPGVPVLGKCYLCHSMQKGRLLAVIVNNTWIGTSSERLLLNFTPNSGKDIKMGNVGFLDC